MAFHLWVQAICICREAVQEVVANNIIIQTINGDLTLSRQEGRNVSITDQMHNEGQCSRVECFVSVVPKNR